jgi:hypothetical protein
MARHVALVFRIDAHAMMGQESIVADSSMFDVAVQCVSLVVELLPCRMGGWIRLSISRCEGEGNISNQDDSNVTYGV